MRMKGETGQRGVVFAGGGDQSNANKIWATVITIMSFTHGAHAGKKKRETRKPSVSRTGARWAKKKVVVVGGRVNKTVVGVPAR